MQSDRASSARAALVILYFLFFVTGYSYEVTEHRRFRHS